MILKFDNNVEWCCIKFACCVDHSSGAAVSLFPHRY